jgi:chorismate synthase
MELSEADIQPDLDRRKPGTSRHVTQRREDDLVEILSGVYEGKTSGTPIALLIRNVDQRSKDYAKIANSFRPGHADYTYLRKYGIRDPRGGGRSSARLTAPAVAAGAVAKKWLKTRYGVTVRGYLSQLGPNKVDFRSWDDIDAEGNPFFVADASRVAELESYMDKLRKSGESVGARLTVVARGVPSGWGEPIYDRLDADIAKAMMGINAVKGVEIGAGFRSVEQHGTEHSDEMTPAGFLSNNAGGILGGISTGQDIVVSIAIKPTSSIRLPRRTIDVDGNVATIETHGRHDPCVGIRATPIAEAFLALVLADHAMRHRAQNSDVQEVVKSVPAASGEIAGKAHGARLEDPDPLEA